MKFKEYKGLDLAQTAADVLGEWDARDTFHKSITTREGHPAFVFYEGPPSANGTPGIHHVMARTIKDVFCRYKTQQGYLVHRKAGWDTHGLPVELGVEKKLGITKEDIGKKITIEEYNRTCREAVMEFTGMWEDLTRKMGYWVNMDDPYITYDNKYIETLWWLLKQLFDKGLLYKGYTIQPYSPAAGTGLSTHELNQPGCYRDVKDTTCTAQFEVIRDQKSEKLFAGVEGPLYFLAWTTTPWTLPSNTALAVGPAIEYVKVKCRNPYTDRPQTVILAKELVPAYFTKKMEGTYEITGESWKGPELEGIRYEQLIPWVKPMGDAFRVIVGDYVTTSDGTGIVHIAPTFGADDDRVGRAAGIAPLFMVDKAGKNQPMVDRQGKFFLLEELDPEFVKNNVNTAKYKEYAGRYVKNAYDPNIACDAETTLDIDIAVMLKAENKAFKIEKHTHSYPHCWRCKHPIIYRATEQWFCSVDAIKDAAVKACDSIQWKPEWGKERMTSMITERNDWCISRQRVWGVPIPIFYCDDCGADIVTPETIAHVAALFREHGSNVWFDREAADLLPQGFVCPKCGKAHFTKETDIMDVWFDSGSTWAAVAAERPYLKYPADLYLEGGDQYRGWFQSSMLTSIAVNGVAPYKQIATHGWTVDGEGKAMHKSLGNAVSPDEVIKDYGADMLRLWVASADYTQDMRISKDIMKQLSQAYLKIRNTARYMLGNLCDFEPDRDLVPAENLMELDRYALHTFNELAKTARAAYDRYEFHAVYRAVYNFCVVDMSNFYLDIIKDRLYCGAEAERRSAQTALYHILDGMTRLIAPILAFTSDEIWHAMKHAQGVNAESVLFNDMPGDNAAFALDAAARERWAKLVSLRDAVNKALENARNAGVFKKAQDTDVTLSVSESDAAFLAGVDLASLCIVSKVTVTTGAVEGEKSEDCLIPCTIAVALDESPKCPRCWNHSEHIGADGHHNQLCDRCAAVVGE